MLLEPFAQPLAAGHVFLDTACDAAVLAFGNGLGREIVNTSREAGVDEVSEELIKELDEDNCSHQERARSCVCNGQGREL